MKQLQLDIEKFVGLTPWASGHPPFAGWWNTRLARNREALQPQRRWWNGTQWSVCVLLGEDDMVAETCQTTPTFADDVEWSGLQLPHPDGYDYPLMKSPRTELANKMPRPVIKIPSRVKLAE